MPIDCHTVEMVDGSSFARTDRVILATLPGVANAAGSGAGAAVTTTISGLSLPASYSVSATANQAAAVSVTNKSYTGFSVTLTPLSSSATLSSGTFDALVVA